MDQDRTESCASPLDEVLDNLPEEAAPEGLQQRCLDALDEAAAQTRPDHPRWWAPVRNVVAVAAGLLLVVGTLNLVQVDRMGHERARMVSALSNERQLEVAVPDDGVAAEVPAEPQAAPPPAPASPPGRDEVQDYGADYGLKLAEPGPEGPGNPPTYHMVEGGPEEVAGTEVTRVMEVGGRLEQPDGDMVIAQGQPAEQASEAETPEPGMIDIVSPRSGVTATYAPQHRTPEVEDPWRDLSGDRQVITQKQMEIEVSEVERAYDEARSIVEKHGGFVASDRVTISEEQPDSAHLTIRLPVAQFESAITDLRQLGDVVRLVGESVDVTEEYYTGGADIREMADREQWLIDRLDNARTEQQRRQLRQQINSLREEMRREKEILTDLAEQTHWPVLELVLSESTGPGGFFGRTLSGSLNALAWVGATAIIWVPFVVLLTLFWRRIVPVAPRSE